MFYLQPERSCVPDSPVWYSTGNLIPHAIEKVRLGSTCYQNLHFQNLNIMIQSPSYLQTLNRILMVREIQEHMLADASS